MNYKELISYDDKVNLYSNSNIPAENKVQDTDMNNIKNVVNGVINGTNVMGNIVVDSIRSKNILGTNSYKSFTLYANGNATYSFSDDTTIVINAAAQNNSGIFGNILLYANIDPTKQYTVSFDAVASTNKNLKYGISPNQIEVTLTTIVQRLSFTMNGSDLINKNTVFYGMGSNSATITISKFQIEEGDTVTSFSSFQNLDAGPVLLWQNANVNVDFAQQTITLNDSLDNYSYYEIIYLGDRYNSTRGYSSGKIPKNLGTNIGFAVNASSGTIVNRIRSVDNNTTTLTFGNATAVDSTAKTYQTVNDRIIPYQILGYK